MSHRGALLFRPPQYARSVYQIDISRPRCDNRPATVYLLKSANPSSPTVWKGLRAPLLARRWIWVTVASASIPHHKGVLHWLEAKLFATGSNAGT